MVAASDGENGQSSGFQEVIDAKTREQDHACPHLMKNSERGGHLEHQSGYSKKKLKKDDKEKNPRPFSLGSAWWEIFKDHEEKAGDGKENAPSDRAMNELDHRRVFGKVL